MKPTPPPASKTGMPDLVLPSDTNHINNFRLTNNLNQLFKLL